MIAVLGNVGLEISDDYLCIALKGSPMKSAAKVQRSSVTAGRWSVA